MENLSSNWLRPNHPCFIVSTQDVHFSTQFIAICYRVIGKYIVVWAKIVVTFSPPVPQMFLKVPFTSWSISSGGTPGSQWGFQTRRTPSSPETNEIEKSKNKIRSKAHLLHLLLLLLSTSLRLQILPCASSSPFRAPLTVGKRLGMTKDLQLVHTLS